ncbi:hypothetical protein [Empedobacter brevis]|uniref:hypothetical protein n=1 Tax=Empedobacter brevis TaxID=247 RepID=UPI0039B0903A
MEKIIHMIPLQNFIWNHIKDFGYYELKARYKAFLNKDVELGMFIPTDENDNPLGKNVADNNYQGVLLYRIAKQCVLFEGWTYDFENEYLVFKISETMTMFLDFEELKGLKLIDLAEEHFTLSESALKQIYGAA